MHIPSRRVRLPLVILLLLTLLGGVSTAISMWWGAYQLRAARQAFQRRDFSQASEHLSKYQLLHPYEPEGQLLAARLARLREDSAAARQHLTLCRQEGGFPEAVTLEEQLLQVQQGDLGKVATLLTRCTSQPEAPETPLILESVIRGSLRRDYRVFLREREGEGRECLLDMRRTERAVDLWCRLCPERADQVQGLVWRGLIQSMARNYPQARSYLRQALALDPDHFQARLLLAEMLAEERPEEAAQQLEQLRQRQPDHYRVRFRLATVRRSLGQLEEAGHLLDEILTSNPGDSSALLERGKVALDERQLDQAECWLRRAVERAPDHPEANLALSQCLKLAGKTTEARLFQEHFDRLQERAAAPLDLVNEESQP